MLSGVHSAFEPCQPAPSSTITACAPGTTVLAISARCSFLRIGKGHDEGGGSGAFRTDGSKYVSPFVASITWRARAGSAPGPNTGERSLLSDPRFILEPDFQWFAAGFRRQCRRYQLREVFF